MSEWYEITDPTDVELVDGEIEINFDVNNAGACYVTVPVKMVLNLFTEEQLSAIIGEIEAVRKVKDAGKTQAD